MEYETESNDAIPEHIAALLLKSQSWESRLRLGVISPQFAVDAFITQLTNESVVSVLLAGFSIGYVVALPDFIDVGEDDLELTAWLYAYAFCMAAAGLVCLTATLTSIIAISRLSNVLATKTSITYMTIVVFKPTRVISQMCTYIGVAFTLGGTIASIRINFGLVAMALVAAPSVASLAYSVAYFRRSKQAGKVANDLAAIDFALAARDAAERDASVRA
jgi:hypothetical protein